jgi:exodeoxyribonuclease-3
VKRSRILSWNIRQGGGRRIPQISAAIAEHAPDIVVINELRNRTAPQLVDALTALGLRYTVSSGPTGTEYGILVASRWPLSLEPPSRPNKVLRHGLLEVRVEASELVIGALYGPMLSPAHDPFWAAMIKHAQTRLQHQYLMIGDFNSGESFVDTETYQFSGCDQFVALRSLGFVDAWRATHGDRREYSWYSFGRGNVRLNGFRLDHALASPRLASSLSACRYSHGERDARLSDHSILLLEWRHA